VLYALQADGKWGPVLSMIAELEHALAARLAIPAGAERPARQWFHLWMIGVAPTGRGRGVGKKLAAHSLAWARARGFKVAFAECTVRRAPKPQT
jgi:GNAT superfamily N-acetyltransferase